MWIQTLMVDSDTLTGIRDLDPGSFVEDLPTNPPQVGGPEEVSDIPEGDFIERHGYEDENIDEPDADIAERNSSMSGQPLSSSRSWPEPRGEACFRDPEAEPRGQARPREQDAAEDRET